MLMTKQGWKITETDYCIEKDGEDQTKELMIVYEKDEAKRMLEYFADSDKYRHDVFNWQRYSVEYDDRMSVRYESVQKSYGGCPRKYIEFQAKLINFVEE